MPRLPVGALLFDGDRREAAAHHLVHRRGARLRRDGSAQAATLAVECRVGEDAHYVATSPSLLAPAPPAAVNALAPASSSLVLLMTSSMVVRPSATMRQPSS